METLELSPKETSVLNAVWTLVSGMDDKVQAALFLRLKNRNRKPLGGKSTMSHADAVKYVKSLSINCNGIVPADENGKGALARFKYGRP